MDINLVHVSLYANVTILRYAFVSTGDERGRFIAAVFSTWEIS